MYFTLVGKLTPPKFSNPFFSVKHWAIKAILTYLESKKIDKHFRLKRIAINWIFVFYPCHRVNFAKTLNPFFSVRHWAIKVILTYLESKKIDKHFRLRRIAINWIFVFYPCHRVNIAKTLNPFFSVKHWAISAILTYLESKQLDKCNKYSNLLISIDIVK